MFSPACLSCDPSDTGQSIHNPLRDLSRRIQLDIKPLPGAIGAAIPAVQQHVDPLLVQYGRNQALEAAWTEVVAALTSPAPPGYS